VSHQFADRGDDLQILRIAANTLYNQPRAADKEYSPSLGVGRGADNLSQ